MPFAYISSGSNSGNRLNYLGTAFHEISRIIGIIKDYSSVYETEPWGFQADVPFLNQVLKVETPLSPRQLMEELLKIEAGMGRERLKEGYHSRTIDLDILLFDNLVINEQGLKIPHPRMPDRRFVLVPMVEMDEEAVYPGQGRVKDLLGKCEDSSRVIPFINKISVKETFKNSGKIDSK